MKRIINYTFLLLIVISCSSGIKENQIVGKWKIINFEMNTIDISPEIIKESKKSILSTSYIFSINNIYKSNSSYDESEQIGKWIYMGTENILEMTYNQDGENYSDNYIIKSLSENEMIWTQDWQDLGILELTLKRELKH